MRLDQQLMHVLPALILLVSGLWCKVEAAPDSRQEAEIKKRAGFVERRDLIYDHLGTVLLIGSGLCAIGPFAWAKAHSKKVI